MFYYTGKDGDGIVESDRQLSDTHEISKAEYDKQMENVLKKARFIDAVYADSLAVDKVPQEWRDEILQRVQERKQAEQEAQNADISPDELGRMIMEVM